MTIVMPLHGFAKTFPALALVHDSLVLYAR